MAQLILSPNLTSITATLTGLTQASIPRVVQFFLGSVSTAPKAEILISDGSVQSSYTKVLTGLKTYVEYTVIVRVIDDRATEVVLEEYTARAVCGGTQLILSPNSTSITATLNGLAQASIPRVVQFFLDSVSTVPKAEILIPDGPVQSSYTKVLTGLKTNVEYAVIVRVIDDRTTSVVLEEYTEKAVCGGTSQSPSFTVKDISTNSVTIELYRGNTRNNYYRLYIRNSDDEEAYFTDWLKPIDYPKQVGGLPSGKNFTVNVGYGDIYGGSVTWIGTQTFRTIAEFDSGHSDIGQFTMPDEPIPRNDIGSKAGALKTSTFGSEYTRVTITTKDNESSSDIAYSVGNDDGLEMEVSCPWIGADEHAAIKIATYIRSVLNSYTYRPYTSSDTLLDPAAELGDLISFDTMASEIINLDINYERIMNSEVSAPTSNETEHEFPQGPTSKDSTKRYVDGVRAALELELDKVTAMVEGNDGRFQKLQVTLDGVIFQNEVGETVIDGSHIKTGRINAGLIVFDSDDDKWDWDDFNNSFHVKFNDTDDRSKEAKRIAEEAYENQYSDQDVRNYLRTAANITTTVGSGSFLASPHIIGGEIYASRIYAGDGTNLVDPWFPETEYAIGDHVYYDNGTHKYWTAANDHISGKTFDVGHWTEYFPTQGAYIELSGDGMDLYDPANSGTEVPNLHIGYAGNESSQSPLYTPYILFGRGGLSGENKGLVKKFTTGMWIGNDDALASPSDPRGIGIFCDFSHEVVKTFSPLVIPEVMYGDYEPTFAAEEGQLFFMLTDE